MCVFYLLDIDQSGFMYSVTFENNVTVFKSVKSDDTKFLNYFKEFLVAESMHKIIKYFCESEVVTTIKSNTKMNLKSKFLA